MVDIASEKEAIEITCGLNKHAAKDSIKRASSFRLVGIDYAAGEYSIEITEWKPVKEIITFYAEALSRIRLYSPEHFATDPTVVLYKDIMKERMES